MLRSDCSAHDADDELDICRGHFRAATFDGKLSAKDRMMLRITSRTLGLTDEECYLVEAELVPVMSVATAGPNEPCSAALVKAVPSRSVARIGR